MGGCAQRGALRCVLRGASFNYFGVQGSFFATVSEPPKLSGERGVNSEQVCKSTAFDNTAAMRAQANKLLWDTDHAEHASTLPHPSKPSKQTYK